MTPAPATPDSALCLSETWPGSRLQREVADGEYLRLLGYPAGHVPGDAPRLLAESMRRWYGAHGRPWWQVREAAIAPGADSLRVGGRELASTRLQSHLRRTGAVRALLVAVSAGPECEQHARQLWQEGKPDEYFFLEIFGSAVVEHLLAAAHHRICALADSAGLVAVPPFSPGHSGWNVAEQGGLHALTVAGAALPGPLDVLPSGMLSPKKSQLAVIALAPRTAANLAAADQIPCQRCAWPDCGYRRAPFQPHSTLAGARTGEGATAGQTSYTVNPRALEKWAAERLDCVSRPDGTIEAVFRFDGTTCSNLGQPLAFEYCATLAPADGDHVLLHADCRPVAEENGHRSMCAWLADPAQVERAIATETPATGRTLSELIGVPADHAVSGCLCTAGHRAHKWRLALEAIHFALSRRPTGVSTLNPSSHDQAL